MVKREVYRKQPVQNSWQSHPYSGSKSFIPWQHYIIIMKVIQYFDLTFTLNMQRVSEMSFCLWGDSQVRWNRNDSHPGCSCPSRVSLRTTPPPTWRCRNSTRRWPWWTSCRIWPLEPSIWWGSSLRGKDTSRWPPKTGEMKDVWLLHLKGETVCFFFFCSKKVLLFDWSLWKVYKCIFSNRLWMFN